MKFGPSRSSWKKRREFVSDAAYSRSPLATWNDGEVAAAVPRTEMV
jgi:hypothetical protein